MEWSLGKRRHLSNWFFKKNGFSAYLGSELTKSSLRQNSCWVSVCFCTSFSLACINPLTLISTISYSLQSALMEWERKASKAQASSWLVYFQMLAVMAIPRTGQLWPKCFIKSKFSSKYCWSLLPTVHLIKVDDTHPYDMLEIWDLHTCKILVRTCSKIFPVWFSCLAAAWWGGPVGRSGRCPGVAIPGRISMSLLAIMSAHEPVVVVLAGMVQEQPGIWLAGMDLAEICKEYAVLCKNMHKICTYIDCISQICKRYARIMSKICLNSKYAVICYKQLMCINCSQSM